ncbi:MAG: addA, partial [Paenibacillaceae bacterium]|nr:addA [Paenibacillaceae bacterium]
MLRSKPQDSRWTDDQWAAITERGGNLLVAAAAGSGKTAVLVERIIRLISDESRPVDVDQLLVATFTNAAAAEMRERIRDALERELRDRPDADHLRRQLALMNRAQITTLHSFCLEVIRRYFQLIPLDPGFRIANETEAQLIRLDVLEQLLENMYNNCEEGDGFWQLADWFGGDRGDDSLYRLVQQLYDQARSMPWPEAWLRSMAEMFHPDSAGERLERWQRSLLNDVRLELQGALEEIAQAASIAQSPGGPEPYLDNLNDEWTKLAELLQHTENGWDDLFSTFQSPIFGKLKACRGDKYDKDLQEQVKKLRDLAKERWGKLREELFVRSSPEYEAELSALSPAMDALVELVSAFSQRYSEAKASKGLVDFADLEHYCLHILRDPESDANLMAPSAAALEFQRQFVEVLLDEYQDTNQVQEAIVALISRDQPGNRFMVGDVKQSIYRFRLADPGLFLQKYRAYRHYASNQPEHEERESDAPEASGRRIDLAQNFRSRAEVVDGVNFIFSQIMNERVGEIAYDDKARLVLGAADYPDPAHPDMEGFEADFTLIDRSTDSSDSEGNLASSQADEEAQEQSDNSEEGEDPNDLNNAQLEARYIANRIQTWMGQEGSANNGATGRLEVWDKSAKQMRPLQYRDIVILLRATQTWAPTIIEELRMQGIPAYAELGTGYFAAIEIEVMLSLLKIVDNPYQDIPLAAVLRSPIFGVSAEQLAHIRIYAGGAGGKIPFYDAVLTYAGWDSTSVSRVHPQLPVNEALREKIQEFLFRLERWRRDARLGALADLIWKLFDDTGYYDFVGGMPGGVQRQANLRALYDRARQYEATSFRGLFRFLRFIERMKETGGDLGTARALGEQEDVVRIMSIHKSKGLEFPVVFVAGLSKQFNRQDLNSHFLLHKDMGFGPKYIDS